jgi:hypothetical protein
MTTIQVFDTWLKLIRCSFITKRTKMPASIECPVMDAIARVNSEYRRILMGKGAMERGVVRFDGIGGHAVPPEFAVFHLLHDTTNSAVNGQDDELSRIDLEMRGMPVLLGAKSGSYLIPYAYHLPLV